MPLPAVSTNALPPANTPRAAAVVEALLEVSPPAWRANCKTAAAGGIGMVIYIIAVALRPQFYPTITDDMLQLAAGALGFFLTAAVGIAEHNATIRRLQERFFRENAPH